MVPEFEMDFCYLLQDPKGRHEAGDQAWATTPVMVDVAAQNPLCAAISTKSDVCSIRQTDGVCESSLD